MAERYDHLGSGGSLDDDCPYAWISEWLCEYVDGTMDPSMQAVFEEYMEANPELAEHVERLCRTRALLNDCERRQAAAERAKARLHQAKQNEGIAGEEAAKQETEKALVEEAEQLIAPLSTGTVAAVASAMTLMLGVGMVAGAILFADRPAPPNAPQAVSVEKQTERAPDRSAATPHAQVQQRLPHRTAASLQGAAATWALPTSTSTPRAFLHSRLGHSPVFGVQPPLLLKKMPTGTEDSVRASPMPALVQTTGLNP